MDSDYSHPVFGIRYDTKFVHIDAASCTPKLGIFAVSDGTYHKGATKKYCIHPQGPRISLLEPFTTRWRGGGVFEQRTSR